MLRGTEAGSLSGWVAFAGPLAFYIATLTPGVAYWDIGEMQTVPYLLGIPHPTGFPLFVLAGWCFSHIFALGEPAWRLSLFSALASAGSAWLLWFFVRDVTKSDLAGLAAALTFSVGDIVWTRAIRAEVHDVALLCTALALVAARRAGETHSPRALRIAALACGLGLATHPIALFALGCALIFAWPALRSASVNERIRVCALGLAPLLLYAYFPLRSAFTEAHGLDPNLDLGLSGSALFDDGSPSSPVRFWRYISGATFAPGSTFAAIATSQGLSRAIELWGRISLREFSYALLAFAALGFATLAYSRRLVAFGFATLLIANVAFAANYAVEIDAERYALLPLWAVVACAAIGVHALLLAIVRERTPWTGWLCFCTLLVTLWPNAASAYGDVKSLTDFEDARSMAPEIARLTNDGSFFIATWNFATPLLYDRYVAHSLGTRRIVCGWPPSFTKQLPGWRARFGHVYVVVASKYDASSFARSVYKLGRWQLAEMR
jgi:4-amino-4-deoxy-L-arabinose transferase-like glycosyltransferase